MKVIGVMVACFAAILAYWTIASRPEEPNPAQLAARTSAAEEAARAERHRKSMEEWQKENPPEDEAAKSDRYLDSRSGPALERTVKRAIDMAGYECDSVRSTRQEPGRVFADCGADGRYLITEAGDDISVAKQQE